MEVLHGVGAGPKEHYWHNVEKTEIANLQFLRFCYSQELRPSLTPHKSDLMPVQAI